MGIRVSIALGAVIVAMLGAAGCADSLPAEIHITGAVDVVYPMGNGGTCVPGPVDGHTELAFSANPNGAQAAVGWVVANFTAAGSYATSSHYVEYAGRTWSGRGGLIKVTSTDTQSMSGTVSWTEVHEQSGASVVSASGSWTCRIMLQPTESPTAMPSPTSTMPSPAPTTMPSPGAVVVPSPTPLPIGTPVQRHLLAPAKVLPAAALCSVETQATADGNVRPIFCRGGAINVQAWSFYAPISSNVMSLGRGAPRTAVAAAMCRDMSTFHATLPEEHYAYELAAAYYGWSFSPEPNCR